jgi:hypothetical protein
MTEKFNPGRELQQYERTGGTEKYGISRPHIYYP